MGDDRQTGIELGLARLADALGEDGAKVLAELRRNSALARLARKMFDLDALPKNRGGRPPDEKANWLLWAYVRKEQLRGRTITEALAAWAQRIEAEDPTQDGATTFDSLKKQWTRNKDRWTDEDLPRSLADLFGPVPPTRPNRLKKPHEGT
jgi:hypothetical protein